MKTRINKFEIEIAFVQKLHDIDFDVEYDVDFNDLLCDYIHVLRDDLIDKYDAHFELNKNEIAFVAIELQTQIEFVFVYNTYAKQIVEIKQHTND